MESRARFVKGFGIATAERPFADWRAVSICEPAGLTPQYFNRLVRESGGYVPVDAGVQVHMNGSFVSAHCFIPGRYRFVLPFAAKVTNLKSGREETAVGGAVILDLVAGETCWFRLERIRACAFSSPTFIPIWLATGGAHMTSVRFGIMQPMKRNGIVGIVYLAIGLAASAPGGAWADSDPVPETDGEVWNRGVDLYRAGNMTNAIAVLKPLMLSKTHGVRASELVGAIEFTRGREQLGERPEESLRAIESAATDLQAALRSNPDDVRMNRNFTRAADRLPELREQARIEKALKEFGQQDPSSLLGSGVREARSIMVEFPVALTNDAHVAVSRCEAMSRRVERLSDMWIALKKGVAQSVTNEQQAMTITAQVDEARAATDSAAKSLADLDPSAQSGISKAEAALTRFWKLAILPPAACDEAILSQSNSLARADTVNGRGWQGESLDYMHAFRAKFDQWAQMYGQKAQSDTNMPPFTAEAQAETRKLTDESIKLQEELAVDEERLSKSSPDRRGGGKAADHAAKEFRVLEKLNRIRELLPKDKNGGGQNQQQGGAQNQSQGNDDGKDKDQQDKGQDQQDKDDRQQNDEQDQGQDKNDEKGQEPPRDGQGEQSPEAAGKDDRQVEDVMRKAQERNDQHEADKKARMRNMPLPSNDRDW